MDRHELQKIMLVEKFYTDTTNRPMMVMARQGKYGANLNKAPFIDDSNAITAYLSIIREKSSVDKKVLDFEKARMLSAKLEALNSVPANEVYKKASPAVIALGYTLAAINRTIEKPIPPIVSFKPLDPGVGY